MLRANKCQQLLINAHGVNESKATSRSIMKSQARSRGRNGGGGSDESRLNIFNQTRACFTDCFGKVCVSLCMFVQYLCLFDVCMHACMYVCTYGCLSFPRSSHVRTLSVPIYFIMLTADDMNWPDLLFVLSIRAGMEGVCVI